MAEANTCAYLGIDIGGTKIGLSVTDSAGHVLASERFATDPELAPEEVLARALRGLERLRTHERTRQCAHVALGVACPGPLSRDSAQFLEPPNMPRWHFFGIGEYLERAVDVPVGIMNDANASVLAEWYWGAARGANTAVFLTMSTGMGAGLIINGSLFEGPIGLAGEIGHIRLRDDGPVGFGKRGSVEGYLSGPGIVQVAEAEALAFAQEGRATQLSGAPITAPAVCELARQGDDAAVRVIDRCGHELGRLIAILVDLLNPDVIVLGTIGTAHAHLFIPRAMDVVRMEALPAAAAHVRIVPSGLSDRSSQSAAAVAHRLARRRAPGESPA